MQNRPPALNVPGPVLWLVAALTVIHIYQSLLSESAAIEFVYRFAFIPLRFGNGASFPGGTAAEIWSPLTYALLHADLPHLSINILWMASFGSALAIRFGAARFFLMSAIGSVAGAAAHYVVLPNDSAPLIGASAGVSAMMGATLRFAFVPGGPLAGGRGRPESFRLPAPPFAVAMADRRVIVFIVLWFALNYFLGAGIFQVAGEDSSIAWQAHIGGFLAGLLLFPVFDPVNVQPDNSPG